MIRNKKKCAKNGHMAIQDMEFILNSMVLAGVVQ